MLKATVIGNIGADAVIRYHSSKSAISFPVAHNEKFKDKDGVTHEKTTWLNCTLWKEKETTLIQYLKKGQLVFIEGTPNLSVYQNKNGEYVPDFSLNVLNLQLLGGKSDSKTDAPWD